MDKWFLSVSFPLTSSTPHSVHQSPTAARCRPKEPSSGASHHRSVVRPWSLAPHPSPGKLVVGSDLISTTLKNLYISATWEGHEVQGVEEMVKSLGYIQNIIYTQRKNTQENKCSKKCSNCFNFKLTEWKASLAELKAVATSSNPPITDN